MELQFIYLYIIEISFLILANFTNACKIFFLKSFFLFLESMGFQFINIDNANIDNSNS